MGLPSHHGRGGGQPLHHIYPHRVGAEIPRGLVEAGKVSVGRHHGPAHRVQVRFACEDLDLLRRRLRQVDSDIGRTLGDHVVGTLLTTMDGIGPTTAAMRKLLIAVHFAANHREPFVPILAEAAA